MNLVLPWLFPSPRRRSGFTLIEMLSVFAVIAVIVALLLPAVQQAREASRRTTCQNNLRQIGLALHNYHDQHAAFPPGWIVGPLLPGSGTHRQFDRGCLWSWSVYLLPMLDQQPLYDQLGVADGADPPPLGDPLSEQQLAVFLCPSDSSGPQSGYGLYLYEVSETSYKKELLQGYPKSNYVAVNGRTREPFDPLDGLLGINITILHDREERGIFGFQTRTRIREIFDGTGNTFAVGEREMTTNEGVFPGKGATWMRNFSEIYAGLATGTDGQGENCNPHSVIGVTHPLIRINSDQRGRFSSMHSGGAYFLFADGAVKFVSDSIDANTYSLLGSMADRQVVQFD